MNKAEVLTPVEDFTRRIESAIKYAGTHDVSIVEILGVLALAQVQLAQFVEKQKLLIKERDAE